jgi:hypothetical protein
MRARWMILFAVALLVGCGQDGQPRTKPQAKETPAITPFPSVSFADLKPGVEYTAQAFDPAIRVTLPEGKWTAASATADHVEIELDPEPPLQMAGIGFHHMTQVFPAEEGGELPGDASEAPDDFADWLTSHPHLHASEPEPVDALGLKGVVVDVTVKSSQPKQYKDCGKVEGECVVMYVGGIEPYVMGSQSFSRFLVLNQPDGKQLVVELWGEPRRAVRKQLKVFEEALASASVLR